MKRLLFSILFCLGGCKFYGTEGGNPGFHSGLDQSLVKKLTKIICESRNRCLQKSDSNCRAEFNFNTSATTELRLNPPFRNIAEVLDAEAKNEISVDTEAFRQCEENILMIDCSDSLAKASFAEDMSDLHLILRANDSCQRAFTQK